MSKHVDILIFGAGIAGLWTYIKLKELGYSVCLIDKAPIGGTQSLASQGMIHGGQRYALQGKSNKHSESISKMPGVWQDCLEGNSTPDLSSALILSDHQYLWSPGGLTSNVTSFFASKAMNSRVDALSEDRWPTIFKDQDNFKGKIYELNEVCLDIKSVTKAMFDHYPENIYQVEDITYLTESEELQGVILKSEQQEIEITASHYIFTAGSGNEEIAQALAGDKKITQRRPLKQILVRDMNYSLYAHCITVDPRPRITISAHPLKNGKFVWYLGGLVAVKGVDKSDQEAIEFAKKELSTLFPDVNWPEKKWATLYIDRAEPYVASGILPEGPGIKEFGNVTLAWPTKLTFAPAVASKVVKRLESLKIKPSKKQEDLPFQTPDIGTYPWEANGLWD